MKISMKWLSQYVDLTNIKAEDLANRLTLAGLEVEGIEPLASGTNLIIGQVISCHKHPQSEHLSLTKVNIGAKELDIVCGAPNVAEGQKVIVAQVGSILPHIVIKETKIKDVISQGMICSLSELGVNPKQLTADQLEGIEVLHEEAPIGSDALAYLGLNDVILDVKPTPNRSDFNAYWSVAYEVGAILERPVNLPHQKDFHRQGKSSQLKISSSTKYCPLFLGKKIGNITVKPSPLWLKQALQSVGMHTINNVVDISNYVMLETGQPLHFYDVAKLKQDEITVKTHQTGKLTTLDEKEINVEAHDIVITSSNEIIGLAGIMGGDDSKIDESTKAIIIEAAQFDPSHIRHTSRRCNMLTEASLRFQKGLDPQATFKAVDRALELLIEYAEANDIEETVQFGSIDETIQVVSVQLSHIHQLLGAPIELKTCVDVLNRLHFNPVVENELITCRIPSYRLDISFPEDLIEEIGRMIGYDRLVEFAPTRDLSRGFFTLKQRNRQRFKTILQGYGCHEVVSYTLVSERLHQDGVLPLSDPAVLLSPISDDKKIVRSSLLPSLLEVVAYNQAHKFKDFQLFEISNLNTLSQQQERLSIVQCGNATLSSWQKKTIAYDFYSIKGLIYQVLMDVGVQEQRIRLEKGAEHPLFHPLRSAKLYIDQTLIGLMGEIHPKAQKTYQVSKLWMAEINIDHVYQTKLAKVKFVPIYKTPIVYRDFAFVLDQSIEVDLVQKTILKASKAYIQSVEVFDVYQGEHLAPGKKSIALSVALQATDRTFSEDEIKSIEQDIIMACQKQLNAELR
jgi:phenylalanyl-tRNA synthetase beta chain